MAVSGTNSMTTFANALKKLYRPNVVEAKIYEKNPTFAWVKKIGDWEGDGTYNVSVSVSYGQGVGPTISTAKSNRTADTYERFAVPQVDGYAVGSIDGKLIRNGRWPRTARSVAVTYTHGYSVVPDVVKGICLTIAARAYDNPRGDKSHAEGMGIFTESATFADSSAGSLSELERSALGKFQLEHVG